MYKKTFPIAGIRQCAVQANSANPLPRRLAISSWRWRKDGWNDMRRSV